MEKAIPLHSKRCAWQVLEGEAVVIDLAKRRVLGLNPAGSLIWSKVDGASTVEKIAEALAEQFDLSRKAAIDDCTAFFDRMVLRGLVTMQLASTGDNS